MIRVFFQNGPDAPEVHDLTSAQFETKDEAEKRLDWIVSTYGTNSEAIAWLEGAKKPSFPGEAAEPEAEPAADPKPDPKPDPVADEKTESEPDDEKSKTRRRR